jgi:hypothetical protein
MNCAFGVVFAVSTLKELELEQVSPQLLEILRRQGLINLTGFQSSTLDAGIMRNTSQLLVTYDYDEAYQIAEITLLNHVASDFRAKAIILCPNPHQVEKRFRSVGHKCRRLGIEASMCTRSTLTSGDNWRAGRVIVSTYKALSVAVKTVPEILDGLSCAVIERLDLIGQPDLGAHLESDLVAIMSKEDSTQYIAIIPPVADIKELCTWLNAQIVKDTVADVKRIFSIKVFESVTESLADLTEFVHYRQGQIAILCSNIGTCEELAIQLSGIDAQNETPELDLRLSPERKDDLREVTRDIMNQYSDSLMTARLSKAVSKGVAFIHEGVSRDQRRTVSKAWDEGILPVIVMPASFAIASGIRATVVFLIGLYTQNVGQYLSQNEDFTILSEWQLGDLLYSAGRRGVDNDAFGIVVVDDKSERDRVYAQYFIEDEDGNISPRLGEVDSSMDDPENAQELVLRHICGISGRPDNLFSVLDRTYWALSNRMLEISDDELLLSDDTPVETLVSLRATKSTLKRADQIPDKSVKLVSVTPAKIDGLVRSGSREMWHYVKLRSTEGVSCSCESWKYQGIRKHRLCKHLVKFSRFALGNQDTKPYAAAVIEPALRGLELVGALEKDGLLVQSGKTMRCTDLGRSVGSLGATVRDIRIIKKAVEQAEGDLKGVLQKSLKARTGIPARIINRLVDKIPIKRVEDLIDEDFDLPGISENCLEEILYITSILKGLPGVDKKLKHESKKLRDKIHSLVMK